jgi:hypothetical protein
MRYEFYLQDPTLPDTVYLFEAVIAAAHDAVEWDGVFAFVTEGGARALITDPAVEDFLRRGELSLLVGLDAVTTRKALEYLQEVEGAHPRFRVRVFWNRSGGLFHPKLSQFRYPDGRRLLIVGSGNLTPGGLRDNFEAYSIVRAGPGEAIDIGPLDEFRLRHASDIRPIDAEALERASRNVIRGSSGRRRAARGAGDHAEEERADREAQPLDRVLVAQVPKAGNRWAQVHYNQEVIQQYFRVRPNSSQRVYLTRRDGGALDGEQEVRPCVLSDANRNCKIELGAASGRDYPPEDAGPPIAVFREVQARTFDYVLLMPGDEGYRQLLRLTETMESVGRGLPRVITDLPTVAATWPNCPLVHRTAPSAD